MLYSFKMSSSQNFAGILAIVFESNLLIYAAKPIYQKGNAEIKYYLLPAGLLNIITRKY